MQRIKLLLTPETNRQAAENIARFYPFQPSPRQRIFLDLGRQHQEVFYGGAAGGGKSDALIIAALQHIHVPGYCAVIFRRTRPNLEELIERTNEWFHGKANWNGQTLRWKFRCPGGGTARLYLGHMQYDKDKFNYKSREFQAIFWDELTEFLWSQYDYLFTRLRRPQCQRHKAQHNPSCRVCQRAKRLGAVPLLVGSASNPDGEGREWVKQRFVSDAAASEIVTGEFKDFYEIQHGSKTVCFVPSLARDNPGIDKDSYADTLRDRDPVTRNRLLLGDWIVHPDGLIKAAWIRRYRYGDRGQTLTLDCGQGKLIACDERECTRIITIDPAGSSEDKIRESKGRNKPFTSIQVWDSLPAKHGKTLVLRFALRKHLEFTELLAEIRETYRVWGRGVGLKGIWIEDEKFGMAVLSALRAEMPIRTVGTGGKDKVTRATRFLNMLEQGQVFIPATADRWVGEIEAEWLSWRGLDTDICDQVDAAAYAAILSESYGAASTRMDFDPRALVM